MCLGSGMQSLVVGFKSRYLSSYVIKYKTVVVMEPSRRTI